MRRSRLATGIVVLAMAGLSAAISAPAREKEGPSALFVEYCARCHGEDGRAQTPKGKQLRARDFTDPEFQSSKSDAELIKTVTKGGEDMPEFGRKLSREQIESLVKQDVRGFRRK